MASVPAPIRTFPLLRRILLPASGVEARDENQNKRLCGGDEFTVRLDGPGGCVVYGHVDDNDDGTYIVRYNATIAGRYQLHVTLGDDEAVAESPYPVRVLPARAFPRRCAVVGDGRRAAVAGSPAEFQVEVKDRFGNLLAGDMLAALPLEVSRVALWNPSHRSRVNSGQRFKRGFDRGVMMESRLVGSRVIHLGCRVVPY